MPRIRSTRTARSHPVAATILPALLVALLAACASTPTPAPPAASDTSAASAANAGARADGSPSRTGLGDLALHVDASAPLAESGALLSSGFSFAGTQQLFRYNAGYQIDPGDFLSPSTADTWRPGTLPQTLGSQILSQQFSLRSAPLYGAPVQIGAQSRRQEALLIDGESRIEQQSLDVRWTPAFAALSLSWMPDGAPADTMQALQCAASGQLRVPLEELSAADDRRFSAIEAGTRACRVVADTAQLDGLTADTWSTGLRWGAAARETSLSLQGVTPGVGADLVPSDHPLTSGTGYQLQLARQHTTGPWQTSGGLAWRRPPAPGGAQPEGSPWAVSAEVSRRLSQVSVAASWKRGDPYWFLPDAHQTADNLALTVDFSPWASTVWHTAYAPTLALSYNWLRAEDGSMVGDGRTEDQAINWSIAFPWR